MNWLILDILLCLVVYAILLSIFIYKSQRKKRDFGEDDGEGGIPASLPPDFDLPPGICLPDDPRVKKPEPEEIFA